MKINTNLNAISAQRHLSKTSNNMQSRLESIASALRINSGSDDAAGLAISEGMRSQVRGTNQAMRNLQDGVSMVQTAEGGAEQVQKNLQRMRELSTRAANDTVGDIGREAIQAEVDQLTEEVDRLTDTVQFNGKKLLNGDIDASNDGAELHAGSERDQTINLTVESMDSESLGIDGIDVTSQEGAEEALETLSGSINQVSTQRADMGSTQNRLEGAVEFLAIAEENAQASESQIRDADMAAETTGMARNQILNQAGVSTLTQANNLQGQSALQLLG
ncbi:MAG: flagellin [bacterium]